MRNATTLIIANDLRQSHQVRQWIAAMGGKSYFALGDLESCPMLPPIRYETMVETAPAGAQQAMVGMVFDRIIIVDYTRWNGPVSAIWNHILTQKYLGAQVVWW